MVRSEKGFTLIEVLITLMVVLVLIGLLPSLMVASVRPTGLDYHLEEEQLFHSLLSREVRGATAVVTNGKQLTLTSAMGDTILYEQYGNVIRRRVNGAGHEVVLQKVKTIKVLVQGQRVIVTFEFSNGSKKEEMYYQMGGAS